MINAVNQLANKKTYLRLSLHYIDAESFCKAGSLWQSAQIMYGLIMQNIYLYVPSVILSGYLSEQVCELASFAEEYRRLSHWSRNAVLSADILFSGPEVNPLAFRRKNLSKLAVFPGY